MNEERQHQVALSLIPHIGAKTAKVLLRHFGSAQDIFQAPTKNLLAISGIGNQVSSALREHKKVALEKAEQHIATAEKNDVQILIYTDKEYPKRLLRHEDSPYILYYKGNSPLNASKTVGIVGTRKATEYGKKITEQIILDLKKYDPLIISGLAYGIDINSHRYSLAEGLSTVGVMANGLDKIYPAQHKKTAFEMIGQGGLLTEEPFGTTPDAPRFPQRNRIIAGLSDVLIVVEAASKGGALITARIANSYDCEVFAVPGNIDSPYSKGCNELIQKHQAHIYTSIKDIEYILEWDLESNQKKKPTNIQLTTEEQLIINCMEKAGGTMSMDNIAIKSGTNIGDLASQLLMMEMKGIIKALPGKLFRVNI